MKHIALIAALSVIAASLTGCGLFSSFKESFEEGFKEGVKEALSESAAKQSEPERTENDDASSHEESSDAAEEYGTQVCTVGNISFTVSNLWTPIDGYEGSYKSDDNMAAYQLQGSSVLGSYEPDEFYSQLIEMYSAASYEITYSDESLSAVTSSDNTECLVGRIEMTQSGVAFYIDVLIAPDKNTVLTFAAQCAEETILKTDIRDVTLTAEFNIGTEDMATGRRFSMSTGTEIHLDDDGTFRYYEVSEASDSSYMSGTYEVYYGQPAFDKLVSMTEYGLTEEELEQTLKANMNGYTVGGSTAYDYLEDDDSSSEAAGYHICRDTFYAIVMDVDTLHENGTESPKESTVLFLGYYLPELQIFDLLNANSYSYSQWTELE